MTAEDSFVPDRQRWLRVLARAGAATLEEALARLAPPRHEVLRTAETGMVMLRGRIGGTGDPFNLGEATITRCAVRLGELLGVGYVLGRDGRLAELVAVLDALLQDPQRRSLVMQDVVEPLERELAREREARSRAIASSRVEFFTMVREAA
jgi:alpha-D-ribose 1-methylphosphonate 5-triphosphate synthase subunit PhnG